MLEQRIADKFSTSALDTVLSITPRNVDDDGNELSNDERREDYLARLAAADDRAKWVCAADELHTVCTLVTDVKRTIDPNTVWGRFIIGKAATVQWHRRVYDRLKTVGFDAPIMRELEAAVRELEAQLQHDEVVSR